MPVTGILSLVQNGVRPAILSYACLPYGKAVYHAVQTAVLCVDPIGAVAAAFFQPGKGMFVGLATVWSVSAVYLLVVAAMSPSPPLSKKASEIVGGGSLVAFVAVAGSVALALSKTAAILRIKKTAVSWGKAGDGAGSDGGDGEGGGEAGRLLFYQGAAMQLGSFVGAIVMFMLVNVGDVFKPMPNGTNVTPPVIPPHQMFGPL